MADPKTQMVAPSELANSISVAEAKKLRDELERLRKENARQAKALESAAPRPDPAAPLPEEYQGTHRYKSKFPYYSSRESRLYHPGEIITLINERPGKKGWTKLVPKQATIEVAELDDADGEPESKKPRAADGASA